MLIMFVNRKTGKAIYGTDHRPGKGHKRQRLCDPQGERYAHPKLFCDNEFLATEMFCREINPKYYKKVPVYLPGSCSVKPLNPGWACATCNFWWPIEIPHVHVHCPGCGRKIEKED